MKSILVSALAALLFLGGGQAFAGESETRLQTKLKTLYPGTVFSKVEKSPLPGLYLVTMGRTVAYVDDSARYFLFGHIWDMQEKRDITADVAEAARKVEWGTLPLDRAIKIVRGNGARHFAVFSDPDCPYCKKLEVEAGKIDNITMWVFLEPLNANPGAEAKAESIWCAADPARAWRAWMVEGKLPAANTCPNPIADNKTLAKSLGLNGTPILIRRDGALQMGQITAEALEAWLGPVK